MLAYVIRHSRIEPAAQRLAFGRGFANRSRSDVLMDAFKEMQGDSGQDEISGGRLFLKRTGYSCGRPQINGQRFCDVTQ